MMKPARNCAWTQNHDPPTRSRLQWCRRPASAARQ